MITEELKKLYIAHTGHEPEAIDELPSSGSNRRYFRLTGTPTLIGVSGESVEENRAFLYMAEHFRQKGLPVPQVFIRSEDDVYYLQEDLGDTITVELFNDAAYVDVVGTSKGKGFQGVVKRHGFGGVGQTTHGQHNRARKPGSIGACSYPAKVFKGMRMGGQMGGDRVTTHNLQVLKVIPEHNLLLIKGSVPGCKGSIVIIEK